MADRPVTIINDAAEDVGPALSRLLARRTTSWSATRETDWSVSSRFGSGVLEVQAFRDLTRPAASEELVAAALDAFG